MHRDPLSVPPREITYWDDLGAHATQFELNAGPRTWDEALDMVLLEMREIMLQRQAKYGKANVRQQGLFGILTRGAADKVARILGALNGKITRGQITLDPIADGSDAQDTFEDGLLDAANYFGPIALMVHRGWWELPRQHAEDEK